MTGDIVYTEVLGTKFVICAEVINEIRSNGSSMGWEIGMEFRLHEIRSEMEVNTYRDSFPAEVLIYLLRSMSGVEKYKTRTLFTSDQAL
ncbi:hypothetical protein PILCRDRAFT_828355 [Piloderma croceum F 1598]|uniref:Uncharacterized protein n=1 Tax=Piloderma croceum (strain F 1598) TaxID=765440 RepID=A0A0C3BAL8_PILCF|nr:hypothetical protein PILCRDRAFT_828355 [Piloderma croceum F 1598]